MAVESESSVQIKASMIPGQEKADQPVPPLKKAEFVPLSVLEPDCAGYNLKVKVMESKTVINRMRPDGTRFVIGEAVIADESACCTLTLRGPDEIELAQSGTNLVIRNAKTIIFDEHIRLSLDRFSLMEVDPAPVEGISQNLENNLSNVAYELVQD